jgi:agmatine deiminase
MPRPCPFSSERTHAQTITAEWEPQDGVLLAWPHQETDWRDDLAAVQAVFVNIVRAISRFERVLIVAPEIEPVRARLHADSVDLQRVRLYPMATNDTWARDFGPITIFETAPRWCSTSASTPGA